MKNRQQTLENRLRRVRKYAFTDDRAGELIDKIKEQVKPYWDRRAQTHKDAASQRFLFRTN